MQQAARSAEVLAVLRPDVLVSSDLQRARATADAPTIWPRSSRTGEMVTETVIRFPSLCTRTVW